MDKIFISMVSYDEKYLYQTVGSAISNAKDPENIVVGIHNIYPNDVSYDFGKYQNQVRFLNTPYPNPMGSGYGRLSASLLCPKDCKYIFQVDAHMLFEKNWDEDILFRYKEIKKDHSKVIITKYLMYWNEIDGEIKIFDDGKYVTCDPYNMPNTTLSTHVPASLEYDSIDGCMNFMFPSMIGYADNWLESETYKEQVGVSGHFMFTESSAIKELLYDPLIPWASDEVIFSLRAHTRGYKVVTIREVIAWHMDKQFRQDPASGIDFMKYSDEYKKKLADEYDEFFYYGLRRIKDLVLGEEYGFWGAPNKESLARYQEFARFDFAGFYDALKYKLKEDNSNARALKIMYDII
jgi:hypothetical protein